MQMPMLENPVIDIIQRFNKSPNNIHIIIEFLSVLPEEVNNIKISSI